MSNKKSDGPESRARQVPAERRDAPARAPRRARERDEILDAAALVFRRRGYSAATIEDIANELGIMKGSLYHYIRSKQDLLYEVVLAPFQAANELMNGTMGTDLPVDQRIRAAFVAHLELIDRQFPRLWVALIERLELPAEQRAEISALRSRYEDQWYLLIQEAIEAGVFRPDLDPGLTRLALLGMLNWASQWYHREGRCGAQEIGESFADLFLSGAVIRSAEAPSS